MIQRVVATAAQAELVDHPGDRYEAILMRQRSDLRRTLFSEATGVERELGEN